MTKDHYKIGTLIRDMGKIGIIYRAIEAGKGCSVYLKRTHENTLKVVSIEKLKKLAIDIS
mgnify:CR=1 FL=1